MKKLPISDIDTRYPNLMQMVMWVGNLSYADARLVIWATKNKVRQPIGGKKVALFGGHDPLVAQAIRYRIL